MGKYKAVSWEEWNSHTSPNYLAYKTNVDKNNELAESNRLKRLELCEYLDSTSKKELSDQA